MQSVLGGGLHKNNTSSLLLGLYHASVNRISIVLMQITPQNRLHYGIVQVEKAEKRKEDTEGHKIDELNFRMIKP